jgi:ribonuclease III
MATLNSDLSRVESAFDLAQRLGLSFTNLSLLNRALTHRSYVNEHKEALEDNERLEFLGDAVLDFLVGEWLYNHFPEKAEGELTRLRSALVRTEQLAVFAQQINLGSAIRLGHGEHENGGRQRTALLCATFEAIVGALYLNSGIQVVKEFIEPFLQTAVAQIMSERAEFDPKSILQEWMQAHGYTSPIYRTVHTSGPEHDKVFEVEVYIDDKLYGKGAGHSKQAAAKVAAKNALELLGVN